MRTNKNIINNLIFTLFLMLTAITANSQGTLQTPMGQTVYVENGSDDAYWLAFWEADGAQRIFDNKWDAVRKGPATSHYNCHSFAWYVNEGGGTTNRWMKQNLDNGNPNLSKYWSNDAYTSTSYVADHEKSFIVQGIILQ